MCRSVAQVPRACPCSPDPNPNLSPHPNPNHNAAYVAARTPTALDKHVFKHGRGDEATGKRRKASVMQMDRRTEEAKARALAGPVGFTLERLLAIMQVRVCVVIRRTTAPLLFSALSAEFRTPGAAEAVGFMRSPTTAQRHANPSSRPTPA